MECKHGVDMEEEMACGECENEKADNKSASVTGYAKFRCNKCKEIVTRNLGWKYWTPSFCEKTGLDARLYRITTPAKTENDIQDIA